MELASNLSSQKRTNATNRYSSGQQLGWALKHGHSLEGFHSFSYNIFFYLSDDGQNQNDIITFVKFAPKASTTFTCIDLMTHFVDDAVH